MAKHTPSASSSPNRTRFYGLLAAIVLIGGGTLFYLQRDGGTNTAQSEAFFKQMQEQYANAGPPQPYVHGDPDAPVVIEEFADYECPSCARFATITEPDIRKRIVDAGLAVYKFYDFPLPMHRNSPSASMAAACADEQGKFWPMHDQIFANQDKWGLNAMGTGEVTNNPRSIFASLAEAIGLDKQQWESCYDAQKYRDRVIGNAAEGLRRNVDQTPTFFVNGVRETGAVSYDRLKSLVDEAAKKGPMSPADSAMSNMVAPH